MKSLGFISAAWFAVVGATVGFLGGSLLAAAIGFGIALLFGVVFGWAIVSAEAYEPTVASVLLFIVDHTWSLANTVAGAVYLAGNLVFGNRIDRDVSRHTGAVIVENLSGGHRESGRRPIVRTNVGT
jgi:ABC-type sulfate transport system permease subunit